MATTRWSRFFLVLLGALISWPMIAASGSTASTLPGIPSVVGVSVEGTTVTIQWQRTSAPKGLPVTRYVATSRPGSETRTVSATRSETYRCVFVKLGKHEKYVFSVRALNKKGSGPSATVTVAIGSTSAAEPTTTTTFSGTSESTTTTVVGSATTTTTPVSSTTTTIVVSTTTTSVTTTTTPNLTTSTLQ